MVTLILVRMVYKMLQKKQLIRPIPVPVFITRANR